jgi:DNA-binding XRE family transcriptional regulator
MALENEQAAEAANTEAQKVEEQFAAADANADPNPPSIEDLASEIGWVPQDKFSGPSEKWKPADQFIREGRKIQDLQSRELKSIRETLQTVQATSATLFQSKLAEQHAELSRKYAAAIEKGDPDEAWKAANQIRDLQARAAAPIGSTPTPAPETEQWVSKNKRLWGDPVARNDALAICNAYATDYPNSSPAEQLAYTESHMRARYPHLFDDKPPPQVNGNIQRNSAAPARGKTIADLPKEARAIAEDYVERGLIPNVELYAKNYFAELEKRKQ